MLPPPEPMFQKLRPCLKAYCHVAMIWAKKTAGAVDDTAKMMSSSPKQNDMLFFLQWSVSKSQLTRWFMIITPCIFSEHYSCGQRQQWQGGSVWTLWSELAGCFPEDVDEWPVFKHRMNWWLLVIIPQLFLFEHCSGECVRQAAMLLTQMAMRWRFQGRSWNLTISQEQSTPVASQRSSFLCQYSYLVGASSGVVWLATCAWTSAFWHDERGEPRCCHDSSANLSP